jgi:hypothetical protein
VSDFPGSNNSDENRRRRSIHLTGYEWLPNEQGSLTAAVIAFRWRGP